MLKRNVGVALRLVECPEVDGVWSIYSKVRHPSKIHLQNPGGKIVKIGLLYK
jgi:hypothetical protein